MASHAILKHDLGALRGFKRSRARSDTVFEELADAAAALVTRAC